MTPAPKSTAQFEQLLEYLRQTRGFDFSGYKRLSLTRRVAKRMQMVNVENFADYIDFLYHRLEEQVQRARQDAETVNEELQATNEELQSTNGRVAIDQRKSWRRPTKNCSLPTKSWKL